MGTNAVRGENVPIWVWHTKRVSPNFAPKIINMTSEEKRLIADCRIMVIGASDFIDCVKAELDKSGFKSINILSTNEGQTITDSIDMIAEYVGENGSSIKDNVTIPIICPFDFVDGAGAIVVMPGDENEFRHEGNMRLWAAEYMAGYCAFWNVEGCDWLQTALPAIRKGETSDTATRTASNICARIAANIAVGRNVKHFPRFYLCKNLE